MNCLIKTASNDSQFIRIDMEDSTLTDESLDLFRKCKEQYEHVGPVLQAYLFRTKDDLNSLNHLNNINVRICKGIYREHAEIAIQSRHDINNNFLKLVQYAFENKIFVKKSDLNVGTTFRIVLNK